VHLNGRTGQDGFSLVEVMVAIFVLLVGVLGTIALSEGAARSTQINKGREEGTNVVRDAIEATHTFQYAAISQASIYGQLQGQTGLADDLSSTAGYQLIRRGITYTLTVTVCTYDDPKDGMGAHDANYCSDVGAAAATDANPSDYKRVTVTAAWTSVVGNESVKQATILRNNSRGPAISTLDTHPVTGNPVVTSGTTMGFRFTTSIAPAKAFWYVDGGYQEDLTTGITGTGTGPYAFTWNLGTACAAGAIPDGTYFIGVQAYDSSDTSPGQRSLTVNLNRCSPALPTNFRGGRNRWGVELLWDNNLEDDVVGYYVYRGIGAASPTLVASGPCSGLLETATCLEPDPASTSQLTYYVRAVDRDSLGNLRTGTQSSTLTVTTSNRAPNAPTISSNGSTSTLSWSPTTDPDGGGDKVDHYRVYRDGTDLDDRYDVLDNTGNPILWNDPNTGGVVHTYRVVAVDIHGAESSFSNTVTR
jgi:prepilin-type N-terminal cleavage/methylation domain-containing protein